MIFCHSDIFFDFRPCPTLPPEIVEQITDKLTMEDQENLALAGFPNAREILQQKQIIWNDRGNYECWDCDEYHFRVYDAHNVPHYVHTYCMCVPHADFERTIREQEWERWEKSQIYL